MKITSRPELDLQLNQICGQARPATTSTGTSGWWERLCESIAPMGYEDQRGFHFGSEPGESCSDLERF